MPERSSKNQELDQLATTVVQPGAGEATLKNLAAVELGRLGGIKGGRARAEKLSPRRRKQIARQAAQARWNKPSA